jgi:tetratricopeptide (TPR) repeat protein
VTQETTSGGGSATPLAQAFDHIRHGRHQAAMPLLREALRAEPNNALIWNAAGNSAKLLGRPGEAERCWRSAIAAAPNYAEAHFNLGVLLRARHALPEAIAAFRQALQHAPGQLQVLNNLGAALASYGRLDQALLHFDQALAVNPAYAKAHHNRGRALGALGRFAEALQAMDMALGLAPPFEQARFYRTLSAFKRFAPGDRHLQAMEALASQLAALPPPSRIELHFALAKAYADCGDDERSFEQLEIGNREKRKITPYDEAVILGQLDAIRAAFPATLMQARAGQGCSTAVPIFILGMPRSGSSLVEQILASHPRVRSAGECEEFGRLVEALNLGEGITGMPADALRQLGQDYLEKLRARVPEGEQVSDKTPSNFLYAGLIHLSLPQAKIIHTRRDAVDTCLSCYGQLFDGYHPHAYELAELGRFWRAYDSLMRHWREVLPPGVMLELDYEALVQDQEGQTRRLLEHCGLEWNPACLDFHRATHPVRTASVAQVREPLHARSVQRWRVHEQRLQPLLQALAGADAAPASAGPSGPTSTAG